jgi:hypothetical protein
MQKMPASGGMAPVHKHCPAWHMQPIGQLVLSQTPVVSATTPPSAWVQVPFDWQ